MEENALSSTENVCENSFFVTGKTPVNNGIQTVFPSVNRTLNTRKKIVFVELTVEENCWIMERILQFADSKTTGERFAG